MGNAFSTFAVLCTQQRWRRVLGEARVQRLPEAESPVPDRQFRADREATPLQILQEFPPTLSALPEPRLEPQQLLPALRRRPDQHQNALLLVFQPTLKVDPVRPDIDIPSVREIPEPPTLVLRLPCRL